MRRLVLFAIACALVALPIAAAARIVTWGRGTTVTCGTTATALDDTSIDDALDRYLTVVNPGDSAGTIYFGASNVTVANGTPLAPGKTFGSGERVDGGVKLYCIVASGTVAVRVREDR